MKIRKLEERLTLEYMKQVEFIRFRDVALENDTKIRQFELQIEHFKRQRDEALEEIERLFKKVE